ncbi:MAG TPA: alpha/beta family hydrolase [Segeticoccus sp.]|uniref:alpha/beta hydrolase family protein n=1 Tax=Segeticoccus sp. TaxID=2706531 RepID=UPI002D7F9957|nr:alpha/beta family hydrolase [Segeticoccus sp.]HET8602215.1 alpha/beta family hydrolase [Segeticoccus sp.]
MTTTSPVRTSTREVPTDAGPARVHVHRPAHVRGSVVLGHGAGGGVEAPDLVALTQLADDGWLVARVEQPWRVAGKRVAPAPPKLDTAWLTVFEALRKGRWAVPGPLVVGGRSAGARVACRTAAQLGADAVLALSFPLHPPGKPEKSRAHEAQLVVDAGTPLAVIQGLKDPFGSPDDVSEALPGVPVFPAQGAHGFAGDAGDVLDEARAWLDRF